MLDGHWGLPVNQKVNEGHVRHLNSARVPLAYWFEMSTSRSHIVFGQAICVGSLLTAHPCPA